MGLDSFWVHRVNGEMVRAEDVHPPRELRLCGGMFSGHGDGSFRGKVYDDFITAATGVSLYQEEITNIVVRSMADMLDAYDGLEHERHGLTDQEVADLKLMFRTYADAGCALHGWW